MLKPRFGQHFLIDVSVARREVDYAKLTKDDIVLEIGPGKGIITGLLAKKAKQVIAIEIDQQLVEKLKKNLPKNVTLICQDVLSVDFKTLPKFTKIVSNLPFQISSPVTFKLIDLPFLRAILIYQKNFAERLVSYPGKKEYSHLTVSVFYRAYCRILENVDRSCYSPVPNVDTSIVEVIPRRKPLFIVENEQFFLKLTRQLFNYRRKKIRYIIKKMYGDFEHLPYLDQRIGDLNPEQIGKLSDALWQSI